MGLFHWQVNNVCPEAAEEFGNGSYANLNNEPQFEFSTAEVNRFDWIL